MQERDLNRASPLERVARKRRILAGDRESVQVCANGRRTRMAIGDRREASQSRARITATCSRALGKSPSDFDAVDERVT
jgi:hypothetical protein